jgi:hypothetical protein
MENIFKPPGRDRDRSFIVGWFGAVVVKREGTLCGTAALTIEKQGLCQGRKSYGKLSCPWDCFPEGIKKPGPTPVLKRETDPAQGLSKPAVSLSNGRTACREPVERSNGLP